MWSNNANNIAEGKTLSMAMDRFAVISAAQIVGGFPITTALEIP